MVANAASRMEQIPPIQKATRHPESKTVIIPPVKHLLPIDVPIETSKEIVAFLKSLLPEAASG